MSKKKSLPTVALQSVFVRDHQRRLRLVIELLEKEARRQSTPPTNLQSHTKNARAFTAAPNNPGGKSGLRSSAPRLDAPLRERPVAINPLVLVSGCVSTPLTER
jgi:hypothetical protein